MVKIKVSCYLGRIMINWIPFLLSHGHWNGILSPVGIWFSNGQWASLNSHSVTRAVVSSTAAFSSSLY